MKGIFAEDPHAIKKRCFYNSLKTGSYVPNARMSSLYTMTKSYSGYGVLNASIPN